MHKIFIYKKGANIENTGAKEFFGQLGGLAKNAGNFVWDNLGAISGITSSFLPKYEAAGPTSTMNNLLQAGQNLPGVGKYFTAFNMAKDVLQGLTGIGTTTVQKLNKGVDYEANKLAMGSGYGGMQSILNDAEGVEGKTFDTFFGGGADLNQKVYLANMRLAQTGNIFDKARLNRDIQATQSDMAFNKENLRMNGGWQDISFGRNGMIIPPARLRMMRSIQQHIKPKESIIESELQEEVQAFKKGGSFNIIPEGALHARLHHMENADDLTKKGIPVVVEKDGGELEQQAEIELNEIIFRYEVTSKIEELMKDGSDNAAIECGKMLVKEIFENTDDRTGLIDSLEEPKDNQEEVVKQHRAFQKGGKTKPSFEEWYKTIPIDRNDTTLYNLKRAYELEDWEQLEKWRNATPEQLKNDKSYHLRTFYMNEDGVGEFVKHRNHPTINEELQFYFGEDGKKFRDQYSLDTSGDYYKYVPRK